jgi:CheY-like chemotaxis protein
MTTVTTVLVVDDDITLRNLLKTILVRMGYNVTEATNPVEAFAILKNVTPNLIILDMLMPVMDGAAMLSHIRKDEKFANVPVIVCTSLSDKETVLKFAALGVHEFLLKPFATTTAIQKIRKVISNAPEQPSSNGKATGEYFSEVSDTQPSTAGSFDLSENSEINVDFSNMNSTPPADTTGNPDAPKA